MESIIYGTVYTAANSSDDAQLETRDTSVLETRTVPPLCPETLLPYAHPRILFTNIHL